MAKQEGLLKKFKLTTTISTSNMHLFDSKGVIKKYDNPEQSMYFSQLQYIRLFGNYMRVLITYTLSYLSYGSSRRILSREA